MLSVEPTITTQTNTNTTFKAGRKMPQEAMRIIKSSVEKEQEYKMIDRLGFDTVKNFELKQIMKTNPERAKEIIMQKNISNVVKACKPILDILA